MKFEVGDRVRVKEVLVPRDGDDVYELVPQMRYLSGREFIVDEVEGDHEAYCLEDCPFGWHEEWLEPAFTPTEVNIDLGELLRI